MAVRLVLIRHAKSDWGAGVSDRERPLNGRGRSQAPQTGQWLAEELDDVDLAVISVAERAQETWRLVSRHLAAGEVVDSEAAYTFDGDDLADVVAGLPASASTVVLVGHNPAMEELIHIATDTYIPMATSSLAILELNSWDEVADGSGTVITAGRPADDQWHVG